MHSEWCLCLFSLSFSYFFFSFCSLWFRIRCAHLFADVLNFKLCFSAKRVHIIQSFCEHTRRVANKFVCRMRAERYEVWRLHKRANAKGGEVCSRVDRTQSELLQLHSKCFTLITGTGLQPENATFEDSHAVLYLSASFCVCVRVSVWAWSCLCNISATINPNFRRQYVEGPRVKERIASTHTYKHRKKTFTNNVAHYMCVCLQKEQKRTKKNSIRSSQKSQTTFYLEHFNLFGGKVGKFVFCFEFVEFFAHVYDFHEVFSLKTSKQHPE